MTTYQYSLELDDSEMIALRAAMEHYLSYCAEQLKGGPSSPFWAHEQSIRKILARPVSAKLTSTFTYAR